MPRLRGTGKGKTDRYNVRLDEDTAAFYKTKANEHGVSLSEYLRQTLVQGVIADNVNEIESRLLAVVDKLNMSGAEGAGISNDFLLAILNTEAMISAIVEARSPQELYDAQDRAVAKFKRLTGE